MKISIGVKPLLVSLAAAALVTATIGAPAVASRGGTQVASVKGTIRGVQTDSVTCGWATYDSGNGPEFQQFYDVQTDFTGTVNASTLGSGKMVLGTAMGHTGGGGGWTYTATQVKNSLAGGVNVNYGDQQPTEVIYFNVGSGTGKFAGVTGGSLQTLPVATSQPFCDPGDGESGEITVGPVTETTTINTTIYGQLIY